MSVYGKKIVVTGASSGIGRATALLLAQKGAMVFAAARSTAKLEQLAAEAQAQHATIIPLTLDITDQASINAAYDAIQEYTNHYGVDVLINNAGYGQLGPVEELALDDVRQQFETNVIGLLAVTQAFLPAMRQRRSGHIFNVSSVGGRVSMLYGGAYTASKFALEALSDSLRLEVAQWNVKVTVIEPGPIATEFGNVAVDSVSLKQSTNYPYVAEYIKQFQKTEFGAAPLVVAEDIFEEIGRNRPAIRKTSPWFWGIPLKLFEILPDRITDWAFLRFGGNARSTKDTSAQPQRLEDAG